MPGDNFFYEEIFFMPKSGALYCAGSVFLRLLYWKQTKSDEKIKMYIVYIFQKNNYFMSLSWRQKKLAGGVEKW